MKTLEEIKEYFEGDRFAVEQGIVIDSVGEERAVCSVDLRDGHRNALGGVQGGLIFTLADFAFAVAANFHDKNVVTLDSTIQYLRGTRGKRLIATALCTSRSRAVCFYETTVADELGTQVARVCATGYIRHDKR